MSKPAERDDLMRKALTRIRELQSELARAKAARREPIAIIGMGCRFPGEANTPEAFWDLLAGGIDAVTEVPASRWNLDDYYDPDPDAAGRMYTRRGGFLSGIDQFDAAFFGISPAEAVSMDPQQRLLLEVAWEALEDAGQVPGAVESTGVYVGSFMDDYQQQNFHAGDVRDIDAYGTLGLLRGVIAGRLAYALNLRGPTVQMDTACSSSLVAIHLACRALRDRDCDLALAGGANLILSPEVTVGLCRMKAMAADGRCKTFDAAADGYVRGEGCGIIVLKRLDEALAARDPVHAVIRGSAVNHDGRSNGLTAPNGTAQQAVIRRALADAGAAPADIGFVEAHGTGTALGDPIEVLALSAVLGDGRGTADRLHVGSVKSNIGHLESAAGVAAIIKTVLALKHQRLPASLHFNTPNPHIPWDRLPVSVPISLTDLSGIKGRLAGVSSFGMSGTNAHLVLEGPPDLEDGAAPRPRAEEPTARLLTLSAATPEALDALAWRYAEFLREAPAEAFGDICHTSILGRRHFEHRLAVTAESAVEAARQLADRTPGPSSSASTRRRRPRIVFLYSGQGSQRPGMGGALYDGDPAFREHVDRCDAFLRPRLGISVRDLLILPENASDHNVSGPDSASLMEEYAQPALFVLQTGLVALWKRWGVTPDVVLGHSVGEYAAAHAAGVLDLEAALTLIAERVRLMNALPRDGGMAAVFASEEHARAAMEPHRDRLSIAAVNGAHVVISGDRSALNEVLDSLKDQGIAARTLAVAHGFHSPLMDPVLAPFEKVVAGVSRRGPNVRFISCLTGAPEDAALIDPSYWARHIREPVRFADAVACLGDADHQICIEIGPGATLLAMAAAILEATSDPSDRRMLASLEPGQPSWKQLLGALGGIYEAGLDIDWTVVAGAGRITQAPLYPFQRRRFWGPTTARANRPRRAGESGPSGVRLPAPFSAEAHFEWRLEAGAPRYLGDHKLGDQVVVPAATYLSMALECAGDLRDARASSLRELRFPTPLAFDERDARSLRLLASPNHAGPMDLRFASLDDPDRPHEERSWRTHCLAVLDTDTPPSTADIEMIPVRAENLGTPRRVGEGIGDGYALGRSFQWVTEARADTTGALCRLASPLEPGAVAPYRLHPGLIDSCMRALGLCLPEDATAPEEIFAPVAILAARFHGRPETTGPYWCRVEVSENDRDRIVGDVVLFDDDGAVILEIDGLDARRLALSAITASSATDMAEASPLLDLTWEPVDPAPEDISAAMSTTPAHNGLEGRWLILCDVAAVGKALTDLLNARGAKAWAITIEAARGGADWLAEAADAPGLRVVVAVTETATLENDTRAALGEAVLALIHRLRDLDHGPRLWFLTQGLQAVRDTDPIDPSRAWIWGLGKVVALEYPDWNSTLLDLPGRDPSAEPPDDDPTATAGLLETALIESLGRGDEGELAIRGGVVHAARLRARATPTGLVSGSLFSDAAAYLVTGAFGALGGHVTRWMVERGARYLLLPRRATTEHASRVAELETLGATVVVVEADIGDPAAVAHVFETAGGALPPLRGILHIAGVLDDGLIRDQSWTRFETVFAPKLRGGWNLHAESLGLDLDFFVCFSSAASLIGSVGQVNYAAANAYLDALMHHRRRLGLVGLSLNWSAWDEAGMAARGDGQMLDRMRAIGLRAIAPESGLEILGDLIASGANGQVGVIPADWPRVLASLPGAPPRIFDRLVDRAPAGDRAASAGDALIASLRDAEETERPALLENVIRDQVAAVMGADAAASLGDEHGFFELGMDSLMGLELRNRLQATLNRALPSTITFEYPSVPDLAAHLLANVLHRDLADGLEGTADAEATPDDDDLDLDALLSAPIRPSTR